MIDVWVQIGGVVTDGRFKRPDTGGLLGDPRSRDVVEACVDSGAKIICIASNAEDT